MSNLDALRRTVSSTLVVAARKWRRTSHGVLAAFNVSEACATPLLTASRLGSAVRQVTLAGVGVARLGLFHVANAIKTGQLVPLLERFNPGDLEMIHAIYLGGGHVPGRVRAFIDHIAQTVAQSPLFSRSN